MNEGKPYKAYSSKLRTRIKSQLKQSNLWTSEKLGKRNWIECKTSLQVLGRMKLREKYYHPQRRVTCDNKKFHYGRAKAGINIDNSIRPHNDRK